MKENRLQTFLCMGIIACLVGISPLSGTDNTRQDNRPTAMLIAYFDNLIAKNIINIAELKNLHERDHLINPIDAAQSSAHYVHAKQLDQMLSQVKKHKQLDLDTLKIWVVQKIKELENQASTREHIHEKTTALTYPLSFVALPEGTYRSQLDQREFIIESGIEIQETPVTQYQWASIMGDNPGHFSSGLQTQEIVINGKKTKMQANWPIESVSYAQVREFINKLNEHDSEYRYDLPSVQEYEAFLQASLGKDWLKQLPHLTSAQTTHDARSGFYGELNKQRVWGIIGNVWQFTRDMVMLNEDTQGFLVFGGSYATNSALSCELLRPVLNGKNSIGNILGFRLVRSKKWVPEKEAKVYDNIVWDEHVIEQDPHWHWHRNGIFEGPLFYDDIIEFMLKNRQQYPLVTRRTLGALEPENHIKPSLTRLVNLYGIGIRDLTPLSYLINLEELVLGENEVYNIRPLAKLVHLKLLDLSENHIENIEPLAHLTKLLTLNLDDNRIKNIDALKDLSSLENLNLDNNRIDNIEALKNLTHLKSLTLNKNQIKNITPLHDVIQLEYLSFADNHVANIEPLKALTNLRTLYLARNQIRDIKALGNLTKLNTLYLNSNYLQNIDILEKLTNLEGLYLQHNALTEVKPLKGLTDLYELFLDDNEIKDIEPLANLQNLDSLSLSHNQLKHVTGVDQMTDLSELYLDGNPLENLTGFNNLTSDASFQLYLDEEQIDKFDALAFFKNISHDIKVIGVPNGPEDQ